MPIENVSSPAIALPGDKYPRALTWAVCLLGTLFFLNCFTPLRLHYDMLRYFAIKECIESKCPPGADPNDYLPYGYTGLLLILSKLGILRPFTIVFINGLFLAGGLYFVWKMFGRLKSPYFLFFLVLLNWTVIKFVTHALSEMQYMFFSLASLYFFYRFVQKHKMRDLAAAFVLAGFAFLTRTVGVALVAALSIALLYEYRKELLNLIKKNKLLVIISATSLLLVILIFSRQLGLNHYTGVMSKQFREGLQFSDVIGWHFSEWGELVLNTSKFKVLSWLPAPLGNAIFFIAGISGVGGLIYLCFIRKTEIPFVIKAYLFFYLLLMFSWPFPDPRFWVPIIPLVAGLISQTPVFRNRMAKITGLVYLAAYTILGLISLGFITYTSFNKKEFSKTQARGVYRNEYEVHFFGKTLSDTATHSNANLVNFLNRYDK